MNRKSRTISVIDTSATMTTACHLLRRLFSFLQHLTDLHRSTISDLTRIRHRCSPTLVRSGKTWDGRRPLRVIINLLLRRASRSSMIPRFHGSSNTTRLLPDPDPEVNHSHPPIRRLQSKSDLQPPTHPSTPSPTCKKVGHTHIHTTHHTPGDTAYPSNQNTASTPIYINSILNLHRKPSQDSTFRLPRHSNFNRPAGAQVWQCVEVKKKRSKLVGGGTVGPCWSSEQRCVALKLHCMFRWAGSCFFRSISIYPDAPPARTELACASDDTTHWQFRSQGKTSYVLEYRKS